MRITFDSHTLDKLEDARSHRDQALDNPALDRIKLLSPDDQRLIHLSLAGHSHRKLAARAGLAPGTVSRRLRRLFARLASPIVAALADAPAFLSPQYRQIGLRYFLHRHPIRAIARTAALSRDDVRSILALIRQWAAHRPKPSLEPREQAA